MDGIKDSITKHAFGLLSEHQERALREITKIAMRKLRSGKIQNRVDEHNAILDIFTKSTSDNHDEVLPLFDAEVIARSILVASILGFTSEFVRNIGGIEFKSFAELPWSKAVESFVGKDIIDPKTMDKMLDNIDSASGLLGGKDSFSQAHTAAYKRAFTMVREANSLVLDRVHQAVARGLGDGEFQPNTTELRMDLDNLYSSIGVQKQEAWYSQLVINNAMNRAWQEGADSLSHDEEGKPEPWVWGYKWIHGDSSHPRPTHLAMNGHMAPVDDPVWQTFSPPPLAHNCKCSRFVVSYREAKKLGLVREDKQPIPGKVFQTPVLTRDHLEQSGVSSEKMDSLIGQPVTQAFYSPDLKADRFPRSKFYLDGNLDRRRVINPTGINGRILPVSTELLQSGANISELLNKPFAALPEGVTRSFDNEASAHQYGLLRFGHWWDNLSQEQKDSIHFYKKDAAAKSSVKINGWLREEYRLENEPTVPGVPRTVIIDNTRIEMQSVALMHVRNIEQALKASKLPEPITVYRALNSPDHGKLFDSGGFNDYIEPGFTSTTLNPKSAFERVSNDGVVLKICLPAGTEAAYLDFTDNLYQKEAEILTQKGMRYIIKSRSVVDGKRVAEARLELTP